MGISKHPSGWIARKMIAGKMIQVFKPTKDEAEEAYSLLLELITCFVMEDK